MVTTLDRPGQGQDEKSSMITTETTLVPPIEFPIGSMAKMDQRSGAARTTTGRAMFGPTLSLEKGS
jgi:hypothetical protein